MTSRVSPEVGTCKCACTIERESRDLIDLAHVFAGYECRPADTHFTAFRNPS